MIHISVPYFPPSANNAYFTKMSRPKGAPKGTKAVPIRVLTNEGRKFKREFKTWLARYHPEALKFFSSKSGEFSIVVVLHFEALYNIGWPKRAKTRHKKIDASNHLKILEDALVEACGHDDSQHIGVSAVKCEAKDGEEPWFELIAWNSEEEDGPLESFLYNRTREYPR
jgi:hypothetical protein